LRRLKTVSFNHSVSRGIGFRKQKIGIEIEQRHRGIDAMDHIDKHDIFRSEAAGHNNFWAILLDSSRQYILWLLRLERSAQGLKFCNQFGTAVHGHGKPGPFILRLFRPESDNATLPAPRPLGSAP